MRQTIGVLGGMGPLATADFMNKLVRLTSAGRDQEHIPLLVYSLPQIPDRSEHIINHRDSPLPAMLEGIRRLSEFGVGCIAIPCHTAHYWFSELQGSTETEILNIAEITVGMLAGQTAVRKVGLLATEGTIRAGIYQQALIGRKLEPASPDRPAQDKINEAIGLIKANRLEDSAFLLEDAAETLLAMGCDRIILACTELPLVIDSVDPRISALCLDATVALARACIDWHMARRDSTSQQGSPGSVNAH